MRQNVVKSLGDTETSQEFNEGIGQELNSCIEGTGLNFNNNSDKQLLQSMSIVNSNRMSYKEVTGSTGSAYIIQTYQDNIEPLQSILLGCKIRLYITNTNTNTNPTIKFDNLPTVYNIKKSDGSALSKELLQGGAIVSLLYDGTDFVLESELTTERNINELNFYSVSSFSANTYNLQNSIKNPVSYYNGLVIRFKSTSTCQANPKIKINNLSAINIVDIENGNLSSSEILQNDIVECVYINGKFHVIKKSSNILIDNNVIYMKNIDGNFLNSINLKGNQKLSGDIILNPINSQQIFNVDNSVTSITITLPSVSSINNNSTFIFKLESDKNVLFSSSSLTDTFIVDNEQKITFTASVPNSYIIISYSTSSSYSVSYTRIATETLHGVSKIATQSEVNAGVDDTKYITPKKLRDTPFVVNLDIAYPVGSTKEFYSNTDPNPNNLPGYSAFTWVRVANGVAYTTDVASEMGTTQGTKHPVTGIGGNRILTIAHIPPHNHADGNFKYLLQSNSQLTSDGTDTSIGEPNIITKGEIQTVGGGQPHNHGAYDIGTVMYSKWVRTA